jgi:hypothetical protein
MSISLGAADIILPSSRDCSIHGAIPESTFVTLTTGDSANNQKWLGPRLVTPSGSNAFGSYNGPRALDLRRNLNQR